MAIPREELSRWIFGADDVRRYTQDSPVLPDVWLAYGDKPDARLDLLLTPRFESTAGALAATLAKSLGEHRERSRLAYGESYVVVSLNFAELIRYVLPLSRWWYQRLWPAAIEDDAHVDLGGWADKHADELHSQLLPDDEPQRRSKSTAGLAWFVGLVGRIAAESDQWGEGGLHPVKEDETDGEEALRRVVAKRGRGLLGGLRRDPERVRRPQLWAVSLNRPAQTALWRSTLAIKADAVARLFNTRCLDLRWAIVDSGIDATHPAFARRDEQGKLATEPFSGGAKSGTRIVATYDFTRLRKIVAGEWPESGAALPAGIDTAELDEVELRLKSGRAVDWDLLKPLLRIPHDDDHYHPPVHEHGTHVAGILAADWRTTDTDMPVDQDLVGVCPDIELYDLRVFDDDGFGDEFAITAALQFIRHLNAHSGLQLIHGVNLSLSLEHDVKNYAVGRTPVCDECERLTVNGVCVVTVAGNGGHGGYRGDAGVSDGYRTVSITDPGNAEKAITVGATHRFEPHTYGVSYFSSRGPTGDGRSKPDLVAPGERINSPVPAGGYKAKDGTSQAAPHVSGAAALLMARYEELRGRPERIKELLCESATDLGRERYFQGAGMVDVLRAMQAV